MRPEFFSYTYIKPPLISNMRDSSFNYFLVTINPPSGEILQPIFNVCWSTWCDRYDVVAYVMGFEFGPRHGKEHAHAAFELKNKYWQDNILRSLKAQFGLQGKHSIKLTATRNNDRNTWLEHAVEYSMKDLDCIVHNIPTAEYQLQYRLQTRIDAAQNMFTRITKQSFIARYFVNYQTRPEGITNYQIIYDMVVIDKFLPYGIPIQLEGYAAQAVLNGSRLIGVKLAEHLGLD